MVLSQKIRELRKLNKLSQEQLAKMLNITSQAISKWETGKSYPDILNLIRISSIFNISLDELIKNDVIIEKSLYNRNVVKDSYILIWGIALEGFSYILLCYFEAINIENSLTNWIITISGLIGLIFIIYAIYTRLPKRVKIFLNSIFS